MLNGSLSNSFSQELSQRKEDEIVKKDPKMLVNLRILLD